MQLHAPDGARFLNSTAASPKGGTGSKATQNSIREWIIPAFGRTIALSVRRILPKCSLDNRLSARVPWQITHATTYYRATTSRPSCAGAVGKSLGNGVNLGD